MTTATYAKLIALLTTTGRSSPFHQSGSSQVEGRYRSPSVDPGCTIRLSRSPMARSGVVTALILVASLLVAGKALGATASGYIPFAPQTQVYVAQGNGGTGTHNCTNYGHGGGYDCYAWDFVPSGTSSIVSATSGRVVGLRNDDQAVLNCSAASDPTACFDSAGAFGNYVFVHNDDGSYAEYIHLTYGSVVVHVGDHIEVGQAVAQYGDTGNTAGYAHLHFSWLGGVSWTSETNFSVGYSIPGAFISIGNPTTGQTIISNNLTPGAPTTPAAREAPSVALAANQDGRLLEAGVANNGNIYEREQTTPDGPWGPFALQPGALATIALAANQDGRLLEAGVANNGNIYEREQTTPDGPWGPFALQPGALAGS
jgi:murein DD-endopeptidase MepM/ murein hydrolase activator NlpD